MNKIISATLATAIALSLSACGSKKTPRESVDPVPTTPSALAISGSGIKGTLANALVEAFRSSDLSTVVATTQTDANGDYSLALTHASGEPITGTFVVRLTADEDTTMICDAAFCGDLERGDTIPAAQLKDLELSTITNSDGSGEIDAEINALTTMATKTILAVAASDSSIDLSSATTLVGLQKGASNTIGAMLGVDLSTTNIFDVVIVDASKSDDISTTDSVAATLTFINGALSGLNVAEDSTLAETIGNYFASVAAVTEAILKDPKAELDTETAAALVKLNSLQAEISQGVTDLAVVVQGDTTATLTFSTPPTSVDVQAIANTATDITGGTGGTGTTGGGNTGA
jgi:hypothetical protein